MKYRLTQSLVNPRDRTHRAALDAGYSWRTLEWALASAAEPYATRARRLAESELAQVAIDRRTRLVDAWMPDTAIRCLADGRAEHMAERQADLSAATTTADLLAWLNRSITALDALPFAFVGDRPESEQLRSFLARARCTYWWRRQLRHAVVRLRESIGMQRGEICASKSQAYVTHDTAERHRARAKSNAAMMEATSLENETGQCFTLAELVEKSPSAKPIRRGELMTRLRGCEELADEAGHRGAFLTLTAPSRFHSSLRTGGKNPAYDGSTPRDAQKWLCNKWANARARLHRIGVFAYGFRIAEPHHDGCPHWHVILWVPSGTLWRLVLTIKRAWLKDGGDEPGARQHRCKAVLMHGGQATGYVAKYIAKNIDDAHCVGDEGHIDDGGEAVGKAGTFGGTAQRVEAWASAWGIRQFQPLGQPPVTVWRDLRRVDSHNQKGCTERLSKAFAAVNRTDRERASWAAYVRAQGGLMQGRAYRLRIGTVPLEIEGRYEMRERNVAIAVFDVAAPDVWHLSNRQVWRPKGTWPSSPAVTVAAPAPAQFLIKEGHLVANPAHAEWLTAQAPDGADVTATCPPWTRVNNCTESARDVNISTGVPPSASANAIHPLIKLDTHRRRRIDTQLSKFTQ